MATSQTNGLAKPPRQSSAPPKPKHTLKDPEARVYVGDCRKIIPRIPECAAKEVDLVFADPPFNWQVKYDKWHDGLPRDEYLKFTENWLDVCIDSLAPHGAIWVNIPDDTAAEIVVHLKKRGLHMVNWCVWHFRFGQNRMGSFIMSKVHALYFVKDPKNRIWRPERVLEPSDRATTYFDPRTYNKKDGHGPNGLRVPMDVWYGRYWGRIQGNNKERRANHENQLPEVYLERVVLSCSDEGMLVMDPFLGSGTTGVVAHELKRRFIGTEYSPANAKSAFQRIKDGPVRPLGELRTEGTAIFPARAAGTRTRERFAALAQQEIPIPPK
ncbi:MAG: site-specific DNA-methyltransferase [Phycisphaeraceae bacterium]|nr:MAG: site-specific DNA-methyltransferase [Phycisphaeraceae bacterium]